MGKLQAELTELKSYIKLTEAQAEKRDSLEEFLSTNHKIVLLDADSLLFTSIYKIHTISELKVMLKSWDREEVEKEILYNAYEKFNEAVINILNHIELDFEVQDVFYFFTTCKKNFRYEIDSTYKANRKPSTMRKWVSRLKDYAIEQLNEYGKDVSYSETLEADDLIAKMSKHEQLRDRFIICSLDKDLKQLEGAHFDYYQKKQKYTIEGQLLRDGEFKDHNEKIEIKEYKGWSFTSKDEGNYYLCKQLLVGDTSDNIKGVRGIGEKRAEKLLKNRNRFGRLRAVYQAYKDRKRLETNIKLIRL